MVGPNGCGKTNIVDAIRWVLGEQKYSILRSGKMEDVIFNGAENFKPLGVCEVALTVHNNAGKLPVEYNDIEIARRVYRNGESEYYLNRTLCRLKDINDLFVDTGMGADAYSVIELKMIEQILSENGDDRRRMFEEAAGINKYRAQRKSTLRKFEATRVDIERINDIIAEVEQKVHHLSLQLKRFKRHSSLTEKLEDCDIQLAYIQIDRYQKMLEPLRAKIQDYRHVRESKTTESSIHDKELERYRYTYKNQEAELNEIQSVVDEFNEKRESLRQNILVWTEQGRGALLTVDRLERESKSNSNKIENLKKLSLDFDSEMSDLDPTIDAKIEMHKTEKNAFEQVEVTYQSTVEALDQIQNDRWELQRKLADDRSMFERTKVLVEENESSIKKLRDLITDKEKEKIKLSSVHRQLDQELKKVNTDLDRTQNNLGRAETKLKTLKDEKYTLSEDKYAVSAQLKSLRGQEAFYHELVESNEGFPEGTRFVLENPKTFPGVLGTVADMFQVDEEYRNALETGLGDLSHCLIAKDRKSAIATLEISRKKQAGDLAIIPLKEATQLKTDLKKLPKNGAMISRASDLVKTSKHLKPLAEYLLGNLAVVEDLRKAMDSKELVGWGLVDKDGTYSGSDMILKNRQTTEHGSLIGRRKKLDTISLEIDGFQDKEMNFDKRMESLLNEIESAKNAIETKLRNIEKIIQESSRLESESMRNHFHLSQVKEILHKTKDELKETQKIFRQSVQSQKSLEPAMEKGEESLESFQKKMDAANDKMLIARRERDEFQQILQDIRIELIELETRRDHIKFKKSSGEETQQELISRQSENKEEIAGIQLNKTELDAKISDGEKELNHVNAEVHKQRSILDLKQAAYRETYGTIEEIQARIAAEQRDREQLLENLKNAELESAESEQNIRLIDERIQDRYNKKVPKELAVGQTEEQLLLEIEKIHGSLENIGPVNMAVKDEYDEENERLEILNTQKNDLDKAEANLRETIRKIDRVARKRFKETMDLIKNNFEKLFNLFFEGGDATLRLAGDPDPLEADIAIDAHPPGKRNRSLRLLSSGEKALTAISLLFAIYQVKPSPYCILDEVDAPLDDVNIRKFSRVLAKFCDETQFIIVTHNKLTMEIADFMYGVTQEQKGVSQLVSVKFD